MQMRRLLALLIPLACAVLFVRLGLWQVDRGRQKAAQNVILSARLSAVPVPFGQLPQDTVLQRWQRVTLSGRFRYDLEQVQAARTNAGSPGVHLLTPLERDGNDTLVVVSRGWVYSPDAASVQLPRWRESERVSLSGYVFPLPESGPAAPPDPAAPLRTVTRPILASRLPAPVAPVLVVMTSDSVARVDSVPRRLTQPSIDAGPHTSYAIQWFSFATIAIVGGIGLFVLTGRKS